MQSLQSFSISELFICTGRSGLWKVRKTLPGSIALMERLINPDVTVRVSYHELKRIESIELPTSTPVREHPDKGFVAPEALTMSNMLDHLWELDQQEESPIPDIDDFRSTNPKDRMKSIMLTIFPNVDTSIKPVDFIRVLEIYEEILDALDMMQEHQDPYDSMEN